MKIKRYLRLTLAAAALSAMTAGTLNAKKPLDHDAFDSWERPVNYSVSNNGQWAAFAISPQEGDDTLTFYNTRTHRRIELPRGYKPRFSADSRYAVALIKPLFADTRKAKIDKKSGIDMPQDSLAIIDLKTGDIEKIRRVSDYILGKEGGNWVAYKSTDTLYAKPKDLKDKKAGRPMVVRNLAGPQRRVVKWVDKYLFSDDGSKLAVTIRKPKSDTISTNGAGLIVLPDTAFYLVHRDARHYGMPAFDTKGTRLAFTADNDSTESGTRKMQLYMCDLTKELFEPEEMPVTAYTGTLDNLAPPHAADPALQAEKVKEYEEAVKKSIGKQLFVNQYSRPLFSHDGRRLIVGVAPYIAPDDTTIVDFERADLDIWRWDAPYTPPMENKLVDKLRENTFPVVIDLASGHRQLIDSNPLASVKAPDRWDGRWALVADPSENIISRQWNYLAKEDLYSVDVTDGTRRHICQAPQESYELSPGGRFVIWFDDREYHAYDNKTGESRTLASPEGVLLWDNEADRPMDAQPWGMAGWSAGDERLLVYDKYDIWQLDPTGATKPECLTKGEGRAANRRYRYRNLDSERRFVSRGDLMVLDVFDYTTKENGLATINYGSPAKPAMKLMEKASFTQMRKAKDANVFSWQRASFEIMPDLWVATSTDFAKARQVTWANPQMKQYSWGTAELVKWYTHDGIPAEGVLYKPEGFSADKQYPMLSVFYETSDEDLYRHYTMEPSWSWVNYPFYVSRGYVVFVPSIHYNAGLPGESAYNYVCSGVEALCKEYPNIDRKRIGIDGQSWGGYQTAYLVTRTNMFACAGSGAPVANMTSAFGGIRWGTGDSRQAQYEQGQSRIGRSLFEAPELYIANSPLFHADRVNTPLLIMHNDADGAVPWYQGIELFMALRRLHKPVWMLQYNGEAHNIKARKNRKDITVRLQQFFDHYLMGAPMPKWMKEGIPAIRKGQIMNYELE